MHAARSSINRQTPEIVVKSIFKRYDEDHNGHLDLLEFSHACDDLGIVDTYEQRALFALADADNSQTIEYDEFLNLIQGHDFEYLLANREDYLFVIETFKTFEDYDQDKDGLVTWGEFYNYLAKHGYSHEYISQYWHYMDENGTKSISFAEVCCVFLHCIAFAFVFAFSFGVDSRLKLKHCDKRSCTNK